MPQTRAQQRARQAQGQTVTPPQRLPITTTTRRARQAPAQPAPINAVASQSANPFSLAPVVPKVPVPQVPKVPSKARIITAFSKEHKVGKDAFTFNAQSESSAHLRLAQQADPSAADAATETSPIFPIGSGSPAAYSIDASPIQRPRVVSTETANPSPLPHILAPLQDTTAVTQDNGEEIGVSAPANAQASIRLASPPAAHQTLVSRVRYDPARGESKVVKISALNGPTMTMSIPEKQLENLFDYLVKMYGAVEEVPELTISTGKRRATEELEDTRPARKVRVDGASSGEVFSVDNLPSHLSLCYQPKQGDAKHSQKYRMIVQGPKEGHDYPVVIPTYDAQGHNTGSKIFVPVQGDEDDTDLDSEVDAASSVFKEDLPTEQETAETGQTDELQAAQALPEASNMDTQGPEESVQLAQEPVQLAEEATGNLLVMPETPNSRGLLGNIVNSAARFIPRFGRATQGRAAPVNAPDTPSQPSTQVQRPVPQTEPRPTTQPQTPSQGLSSTLTRAASVQKPQTKGKARVSEAVAQLNVRKKADKFARRMEPLEIEAKRRAIEQRILELEQMDKDLKLQEEKHEARLQAGTAEERPSIQTPAFRGGWRKRAGLVSKTNTIPQTEEEQAANALWPPGRRIAEAQQALQRRKNPSGRIRGPLNKGSDINDNLSPAGNEGDDAATSSNTNGAPAHFTPHDPSYPVGDPYSARPARGSFFHEGPSPTKLHGGNLFRNVDADHETASSYLFHTPRGEPIVQFNKTGHFQLPDESSSDEDEPSSSATRTPAPQTSTEEPAPKIFSASPLRIPETPTPAAAAPATQSVSSVLTATPVLKGILKNTSYTPKVYPKGQWEPYQETIARNKREAAEALARDKAEDARKRELAEEARKKAIIQDEEAKKAIIQEEAMASKRAIAKAAALKYAPKEPSKLNFVEQAASSPLAAPSEKSFNEAASSAEMGEVSPTAIEGAEAPSAAQDENDALTDDGSDNGSTSSADSQENVAWRGNFPMSQRAIGFVNSQFTSIDVEAAAKEVRADYNEFLKTYKPTGPETKFSPRVQEWLNSAEVQRCIEEDTPIIAAEIRRSFERGYAL